MAALSTVRNVEIARVGVWHASTGVWECTREQLEAAVAAQDDPAFRPAVLKIGHTDPRFNSDDPARDGEPAVGRVANLRLSADGQALIADFELVPTWLAEIIQSAYPSRSVEMYLGVVTAAREYAAVLTGVALLGATAPAIECLGDVATVYQQPTAVDAWVAAGASRVAASFTTPAAPQSAVWPPLPDLTAPLGTALSATTGGTMPTTDTTTTPAADGGTPPAEPTRVAAAASIEDLRTAFYEWIRTAGDDERGDLDDWAWICEVWTESLIVDDDEGHLWRVTWTETNGAFAFGVPQRVTRTYVPLADTITARAVHAAHRPVRYFRGRAADVSASKPEETPAVSEIPAIAQALRDRLGLGADVTDEAVLTALDERLNAPAAPATQSPAGEGDKPAADTTTAPAAASQAPAGDAPQADPIAARLGAELERVSAELAEIKAAKRAETKATVIDGAVKAGKITPAERAKWEADYDAAPQVIEGVLARMAPGTAVPVAASGTVGHEPTSNDDDEKAYAQVFAMISREG